MIFLIIFGIALTFMVVGLLMLLISVWILRTRFNSAKNSYNKVTLQYNKAIDLQANFKTILA